MLGLDVAFAPLVPYSGVPLLLAAGAVQDEPIVVDGELAVGKMMNLCDTFHHRFIDGVHAARLSRTIRRWIEDPMAASDRSRRETRRDRGPPAARS